MHSIWPAHCRLAFCIPCAGCRTAPQAPARGTGNIASCWLQARVKAISEVVEQLVRGVKAGLELNVDAIKREAATKYALARAPKLVEIISAVPDDFRDTLLPRCSYPAAMALHA